MTGRGVEWENGRMGEWEKGRWGEWEILSISDFGFEISEFFAQLCLIK
jgi:hypothetical protein